MTPKPGDWVVVHAPSVALYGLARINYISPTGTYPYKVDMFEQGIERNTVHPISLAEFTLVPEGATDSQRQALCSLLTGK